MRDELVVERKANGRDAHQHSQQREAPEGDVGEGAAHQEAWDNQQQTADAEAVARAHNDINAARHAARQERGHGTANGVDDNHTIAQPTPFGRDSIAIQIENQYARHSQHYAHHLAQRHAVALEEYAGQHHDQKDAQRIENGCARPFAVREADVEAGVVERGIDEGKQENEAPVPSARGAKRAVHPARHRQNNEARDGKSDAREEHLAARHIGRDSPFLKSNLDNRVSPAPQDGCREGKEANPHGTLEERKGSLCFCWHVLWLTGGC